MRRYRNVVAQTIHYFSRPHTHVRRTPILGPAAWRGSEISKNSGWIESLSPTEINEIEASLRVAHSIGHPSESLSKLDFPLPKLAPRIDSWRKQLNSGRGFVVLRGLPIERWSSEEAELFFWCFGLHLGIPGTQNREGHQLGHVRDLGVSPDSPEVRLYKTSAEIRYHCDAADVVGLLCIKQAQEGGRSRIVSSVSVYNELLRRRPDLVALLYQSFELDTRGEGGIDHYPVPACRYAGGTLRTFYHSDYFRSAPRYDDVPPLSRSRLALLNLYDEIANSEALYLEMDLEPGDIQLVSNHSVIHARTAYTDSPTKQRHLLRLWLSLPHARSKLDKLLTQAERLRILASFAKMKWNNR